MSNTEEFDVNDRLTLPAILEDPQSHFCVCPSHTPLIDSKHTESYFLAIENSLPQPRFISSTNEVHTSKGIPTRSVRHFVQSSSNNVKAPILNNHSSSSQQYCLSCQPLRTTAVQGGNIQPFNLSNMIQLEIVDGKPKVIRQSESSVPTKPPRSFESLLTHSTADDINNSSNAALSVPINNKRKNLTQGTNRPPPPYISENDKKDIDSLTLSSVRWMLPMDAINWTKEPLLQ
ncbi:unnamed protein product [Didymodactylos carnosus]|uniref:Uncharacterized protein n=1 Tax=Didymodactylos carnosus TaxID=1234261 RepID=A0A8S2GSJ9_9BILA|nr:unnamed protein product [Didymodactylos carnosus]CAF3556059.1 unnamed protein product [Didymodactylos carnosus]